MIDFRFHLISLVAVFLALGLGILMGSVVLDQQIVQLLEKDIRELRADKAGLQDDVITLERQLNADARFAELAEDWLVAGALEGREFILLRFDGASDGAVDGVTAAIEGGGGRIPATITLTDRLALPGVVERDQLALAVESSAPTAGEIRADAGDFLGSRLGSAVASGSREGRIDAADNAAINLLLELEDAGFAEVDGLAEGERVPGADLVVVGGSVERRPFNLPDFLVSLARGATARGAVMLFAESSDSTWGMTAAIRSDDIENEVVTVDHAETVAGRVATALALRNLRTGTPEHYGTGPGAAEVIPRPSPED